MKFFNSKGLKKPKESLVSKLGIRGICGTPRAIVGDPTPVAKPVNISGRTKEQIVQGMETYLKVSFVEAGCVQPFFGYGEEGSNE